jgi:hypothetical protein
VRRFISLKDETNRADNNGARFPFFLSVFCEPFKLVQMNSRPLEDALNATIRRQRHLNGQRGRVGPMALNKTQR